MVLVCGDRSFLIVPKGIKPFSFAYQAKILSLKYGTMWRYLMSYRESH